MRQRILKRICDYFLGSLDFNGILIASLCEEFGVTWADIQPEITRLVQDGQISLAFGSHSLNPHIKRLRELSISEQLDRLGKEDPLLCCAYPSTHAVSQADLSAYDSRPFTKRLSVAEAHLTPVFFELDILDRYYRDPRYRFDFQDFGGSIRVNSEIKEPVKLRTRDEIFLQSFGIGYDSSRNRVAVVFLRYLSDLSPEHQQIWNAHIVTGDCTINSDYSRAMLFGEWHQYHSAYQALLTEHAEINKLTRLMGKPPLFRQTVEETRPDGLIPLLRPTRQNFYEFIHVLDKILSENINQEFFRGDIQLEERVDRDGIVEVQRLGSLRLLETWLRSHYRTSEREDVSREVVAPFKEIRKLRQEPAHGLTQNEYERSYCKEQDRIVGDTCRALTMLRLIFWSHPRAREQLRSTDMVRQR